MKRLILLVVLSLFALPLWADFGLSNVVTKEIHRTVIPAEPLEEPVEQVPEEIEKPISFTKTAYYPYTIHMSSWQDPQDAIKQLRESRSTLETVFITKIDLGSSGIWYRVDYGVFHTIKDAVTRLRELVAKKIIEKGAFVGSTVPYTIEIGIYNNRNKAVETAQGLEEEGIITYILQESDSLYRLVSGAYPDPKSAAPAYNDLKASGINPKIKKR
jgi:hypothetical protein